MSATPLEAEPFEVTPLLVQLVDYDAILGTIDGLNDAGWIIGSRGGKPFVCVDLELQSIGEHGGRVVAINNSGVILGMTIENEPFLWQDGHVETIDIDGIPSSVLPHVRDINDSGILLGDFEFVGMRRIFIATPGNEGYSISEFVDLPRRWYPVRMNRNNDVIINNHELDVEGTQTVTAYFWRPGNPDLVALGDLGGGQAWPRRLNDVGRVVGYSHTCSGESRAFVWDEGTGMKYLRYPGDVSSGASDINEAGVVVGGAGLGSEHVPVMWIDGLSCDLNRLVNFEGTLSSARFINNSNQILASGNRVGNPTSEVFFLMPSMPLDEIDLSEYCEEATIGTATGNCPDPLLIPAPSGTCGVGLAPLLMSSPLFGIVRFKKRNRGAHTMEKHHVRPNRPTRPRRL